MANYYDIFIGNYELENPIMKTIYDIASCIKLRRDYMGAINLILENNLTLEDVVSRTARLTLKDVVTLADILISRK
ncbi:hypothetical protein CP965_08820 [Halarcobacter mediterraneus]|uniref:Uncharacterized protein n=1 Tax=Halarcobacter mediterraneus TaxID=2023153 RepID=A0A4Q1AVM8_9BACT|nr:hypothetical protein [Halarcobacter mediterraneus]RXK12669.1 hypothetical protein CP965_08820 [Halarcobacter mediterraneus]